ncbi:MAG: shikimate kinase [Planctomycetota bacterium]
MPAFDRHILLMGLRASGKSSLARLLGARLGMDWLDLDARTPSVAGRDTVRQVFELDGEAGFRAAELEALHQVLVEPPAVIALGGGTPTATGASGFLTGATKAGAPLIYLRAQPDTLAARLAEAEEQAGNEHRPSLSGKPITDEIAEQFEARDPLYKELATQIVDVDGLEINDAATRVIEAIAN